MQNQGHAGERHVLRPCGGKDLGVSEKLEGECGSRVEGERTGRGNGSSRSSRQSGGGGAEPHARLGESA